LLKGWSQHLAAVMRRKGAKTEGAHLRLLRQRQNMKGNDSTVELSKVNQNTQKHTDKSCNVKKVEDKLN